MFLLNDTIIYPCIRIILYTLDITCYNSKWNRYIFTKVYFIYICIFIYIYISFSFSTFSPIFLTILLQIALDSITTSIVFWMLISVNKNLIVTKLCPTTHNFLKIQKVMLICIMYPLLYVVFFLICFQYLKIINNWHFIIF